MFYGVVNFYWPYTNYWRLKRKKNTTHGDGVIYDYTIITKIMKIIVGRLSSARTVNVTDRADSQDAQIEPI